jgi:hypothetical protein
MVQGLFVISASTDSGVLMEYGCNEKLASLSMNVITITLCSFTVAIYSSSALGKVAVAQWMDPLRGPTYRGYTPCKPRAERVATTITRLSAQRVFRKNPITMVFF